MDIIPEKFFLHPAYPNPFNAMTRLHYDIPEDGQITLKVYDLNGRLVETLVDDYCSAGVYHLSWNAGYHPSGIYFLKLSSSDQGEIRKITLIK